jgi:hypothetical protein
LWQRDYNRVRPHNSLGDLAFKTFVAIPPTAIGPISVPNFLSFLNTPSAA